MKKAELTKRERILAALHLEETDRLCWSPLIDPYFINSLHLQNIHLDIIEAMRYIGNDIMERHVASPKVQMKNKMVSDLIEGEVICVC